MQSIIRGLRSILGGVATGGRGRWAAQDDDETLREIESHAVRIARESGAILRAHFELALNVEYKDDKQSDPVTNADYACQTFLTEEIGKRFPGHGILGEEDNAEERQRVDGQPAPDFVWVLDPLDGTRNFLSGLPLYASSIGVLYRGTPVVAAVFMPWPSDEGGIVMHARRGGGTHVDGEPVTTLNASEARGQQAGYPAGGIRRAVQCAKGFARKSGRASHDRKHRLRACDGGKGRNAVHDNDRAVPVGCSRRLAACDGGGRHRAARWKKQAVWPASGGNEMAAAGIFRAVLEQRHHHDEGAAGVARSIAAGQSECGALCGEQPARAVKGQAAYQAVPAKVAGQTEEHSSEAAHSRNVHVSLRSE